MATLRKSLLGLFLVMALVLPAHVLAQQTFTEDFTTSAFKDTVHTTADWNTDEGQLRLPRFVPKLLGSFEGLGAAYGITLDGDLVFVCHAGSGISVVDISDPTSPQLISSLPSVTSYRLVVEGNIAYSASTWNTFDVIDISDPSNPVPIAGHNLGGSSRSIAVAGDFAYVTQDATFGGHGNMLVYDVSDPAYPTLATQEPMRYAENLTMAGDYVYVCSADCLKSLDVSDPMNPVTLDSLITGPTANMVKVAGDQAYVACYNQGLFVIDISDPANMSVLGRFDPPESIGTVSLSGDLAYVGIPGDIVWVLDISDPGNPIHISSYDAGVWTTDFVVAGEIAVVGTETGFQVLQVSPPVPPDLIASPAIQGHPYEIVVDGDWAYMANYLHGFQVIDIRDTANPVPAGVIDTPGLCFGVAVAGDLAMAADGTDGLHLIDVSDPTNPILAGTLDTSGHAWQVEVSGRHAYVADRDGGVQVIDIQTPSLPVLTGNYPTMGDAFDIVLAGDVAYVADGPGGLLALDISDSEDPAYAGSLITPGDAIGVACAGDLAFLGCGEAGVHVADISDPGNPVLVGSCDTPGTAGSIFLAGDMAFVSDGTAGFQVLDISDPVNPVLTDNWPTSAYVEGVTLAGSVAYVCDGSSGLKLVQVLGREIDVDLNIGQALPVDQEPDNIVRAWLTSDQTPGVSWELSADSGLNWTACPADGSWARINIVSNELVWRTTHTWAGSGNPAVSGLNIGWLNDFAPIVSVEDVPADEGGWVRLEFSRSGYDFADEGIFPIMGYWIHQRIDDMELKAGVLQHGLPLDPASEQIMSPVPTSLGELRVWGDRIFLVNLEKRAASFPPGIWEVVGSAPGLQQDHYSVRLPTLVDSPPGQTIMNTYLVTAHTTSPAVWFASYPDSGYSRDNLPPGQPMNFTADYLDQQVLLDWDDSPENDLQYYHIYRGSEAGFIPGAGNLIHETSTSSWTDTESQPWGFFYKVSALDTAENESDFSSPVSVTGVQGGIIPARTALLGAVPNPFNPSTKLSFDMAAPGHVRLKVYDTAGRLVKSLMDEHQEAGHHQVIWGGRDDRGRMSSAGVYLYRLETGDHVETKRMTLVK